MQHSLCSIYYVKFIMQHYYAAFIMQHLLCKIYLCYATTIVGEPKPSGGRIYIAWAQAVSQASWCSMHSLLNSMIVVRLCLPLIKNLMQNTPIENHSLCL